MKRRLFISLIELCSLACLLIDVHAAPADSTALPALSGEVHVEIDGHGRPHVFAQTWPDAARVLGYLHAGDRLWEMDMFRRQAKGTTAEILGKSGVEHDVLMRQLGIRRTCEQMWNGGDLPDKFRAECEAYAAGVNAKIAELGERNLPGMFAALDYKPAPWQPVDCLVFSKYMGWDQSGTSDDLWFGTMVEKLGVTAAEELWPLERPYEVSTVQSQSKWPAKKAARAQLVPLPPAASAFAAAFEKFSRVQWYGRGASFGSNNWAVDGSKTASGKPILCNDPHLGFRLPSIWYAAHVSVGGENIAGVTFPGSPVFVLGQNDHIGWGVTNMQTDAVDYFVETVDEKGPTRYRHRGEWKQMQRVTEEIPVRGESPHVLHIDSTVHGPVVNRNERTISLEWTGLKPTKDSVAFWRISHAKNLDQFLAAADDLTVPPLNLVYADDAGNIAMHPCGEHPLRLVGQGRIPMDGASGESDWAGSVPRDKLPLSVNPANHFVASANGRPSPLGYPHYLGWMWDPSYRIRRINDMLGRAHDLTVDSMRAIQLDAYDKAAERFVPVLLEAIFSSSASEPLVRRAADELKKWDYVASVDAIGPAIWLRWFDHYRKAVWNDEWTSRGIQQPGGSWGFCGDNHREPMLEVLEYLTREFPRSIWFDDRTTPQRETRDDILRSSFASAIASLAKDFGDDPRKWRWGNLNTLKIGALSGQPDLGRNGGPIAGTSFTVNPGGDIGPVGSGASWRQIIDLADLTRSIGVYPGGQSENPESPLYADQMPLWAKGEYLPINMIGDRAKLAAGAKTKSLVFAPR